MPIAKPGKGKPHSQGEQKKVPFTRPGIDNFGIGNTVAGAGANTPIRKKGGKK